MRAAHMMSVEIDTCTFATWSACNPVRLQAWALGDVEVFPLASEVMGPKRLEGEGFRRYDGIGLGDLPMFASLIIDGCCRCRMLRMRSGCGFATLSTSAISLRGLAYICRAECF